MQRSFDDINKSRTLPRPAFLLLSDKDHTQRTGAAVTGDRAPRDALNDLCLPTHILTDGLTGQSQSFFINTGRSKKHTTEIQFLTISKTIP